MIKEIAQAVAGRQISARELMELTLARIADLDPELNAVTVLRAEEALAEAEACDELVANGGRSGPLQGVPTLVKDIEDVAGMRTTFGSLMYAHSSPATSDGLVPSRLRAAGAIIVGKTNLPEFACEAYTSNRLYGTTKNPWGRQWSPGGSSGGSAAALAAGMAGICTATDGGGSIRIPASLCGLAGLKPTNGIIGRRPIPAWMDLSTEGPLATSVDDLAVLLDVYKGPVPGDPTAIPHWSPVPVLPKRILAAPRTYDWGPLPAEVADAFDRVLGDVEDAFNVPVTPVSPDRFTGSDNPDDDWCTICFTEQAHHLGREQIAAHADDLDPVLLRYMQVGLETPLDDYLSARRRRFDYVRRLDEMLGADGVLLTPTVVATCITKDGYLPGSSEAGVEPSALNTSIQNLTGHPAISLPAGTLANGLPFGIQFTAPRFADGMLLSMGLQWEAARPWPTAAPGYSPFSIKSLTA